MPVYLGIDCGGSTCRALAVDGDDGIVHSAQSGSANLVSTSEATIMRSLASVTEGCVRADYVCGCFAGLLTESHRAQAERYLSKLYPYAALRAEPDYTAALFACPVGTDICVLAGTGSIVCSLRDGKIAKSGGRGFALGDQGSAYHCGRDALEHFLDHPSGASETFLAAIDNLFGTRLESEIVAKVYQARSIPALLAKYYKPLVADARSGLPYATEILRRNLQSLAAVVRRHAVLHFPGARSLNVCVAGGVWQGGVMVRDLFTEALEESVPSVKFQVTHIQNPPLHGAVQLAKELNGVNRVS